MPYYNNRNNESNQNYCYMRFLNAIPDSPALDIYMNGEIAAKNLAYSNNTHFQTQPSNTYEVDVYKHNTHTEPIFSIKVYLFKNTYYTIPLVGTMDTASLELIADRPHTPEDSTHSLSYIRFVNLSPNSDICNIQIDTIPVFYHSYFMEVSNYLPIRLQKFTISAIVDDKTYSLSNFTLKREKYYTAYILGLSKGLEPGISIHILEEGRGNFDFS